MFFVLKVMAAGMIIMAPLYEAARDFYGDTGFFIALAGLSANMVVFGTLCIPSKLEIYYLEKRKSNLDKKTKDGQSAAWQTLKIYLHVAKQKSVLCLCFCMISYNFGKHLVFLHLPKYCTEMGFTPAQASFLLSLSGIMGIIGRPLAGLAANNEQIDDLLIYSGTMGMTGLATILFPLFSKFYVGQTVYAIFLGLNFGCCYVVTESVFIKLVGVEFMAKAIGFQFIVFVICSFDFQLHLAT